MVIKNTKKQDIYKAVNMELTESCHHRALIKEFYEIVFFTFVMVPDMRQFEVSFHYIFCENGRLLDWPSFTA